MKIKQAVAMLVALVTIEVQAELVIYHDRASFLAAVGSVVVYDFESDSAATISPPSYSGGLAGSIHDFGDFSIDATSTGIYEASIREQGENMDIYLHSYNNSTALNVLFDDDVTSFGFNYIAEGNNSYDHSTFSLLGQTWDLGTPGSTGFFGVVETTGSIAAGTAFSFGQNSSNWNSLSFDNVTYSAGNAADFQIASISVHQTNMVGTVNMALGKSITPHTNVVRGDPQNVVDGDFGTLWYSYQGGISTIYFTLDIGREVIIGRYVYRLSQTSTYLIETSNDGVEWTNRYSGIMSSPPPSSAIFTNDVFGAHTARYFRYTGGNSVNAYVGINEFQVFEMKSPHIAISFPSQSNRCYTLQENNDLSSLNWTNVVGQVGVLGNGDTISLEDTNLYSPKFYRVQESDVP